MPTDAICRREVESLHDFFLDWYTGQASEDAAGRVERALGPGSNRQRFTGVAQGEDNE